ncbi:GTP-binding protein [Pelagicoccus sp. SDUM812005]|uniref:CobW family GTP-binding protein n=1 Tax=Pelagicoccus sp. SDUM812005 TaxID=3041257 RepID=UPI00280C7EA1|nr:GTP-binding protein [Pelagicoccus sp. SDUM812005]MDQ8181965.1 GTP-binding protein [Pelagicoccus sp. SDUM812005]
MGDLASTSDTNSGRDASDGRIPLVVLGGFLGAGKTTVLNHLLREAKGRRIAALVNDVGEVNIDAALAQEVAQLEARSAGDVVELSNGCICCGMRGAFGEAVVKLAERKPEVILVEATGIAEPQGVVGSLVARDANGVSPLDLVRIVNLVTVVDAGWWVKKVEEAYTPVRRSLMLLSDPRRPLSELLALQVEAANVIVLNKVDLVEQEALLRSRRALAALCPEAEVLAVREGRVDWDALLDGERFDVSTAFKRSRCDLEFAKGEGAGTGESAKAHRHSDFGLEAFVFRARFPVSHGKLLAFLRSSIPGLLRAKGFVWTDREPDRMGYLSLAGDSLRFDHLGKWRQALLESGEIDRSRIPAEEWLRWDAKTGDRRQEIVFIGIDLDREKIESALRSFRLREDRGERLEGS